MKHALFTTLLRIIGSKKVMRPLTARVSNAPGHLEVLFYLAERNLTKLNFFVPRENWPGRRIIGFFDASYLHS